jgi:hypothetical protein
MARPKQSDLPAIEGKGVAPIKIPAIDRLADKYIEMRDKRMAMTPEEVKAKQALIEALHKNEDKIGHDPTGAIVYRYDTIVITLASGKEKLKVKDMSEVDDDAIDLDK